MTFDDYLAARKHHLMCSIFWNDGWFESVAEFAGKFGIKRSEWLRAMLPATENETGPVRELLENFVHETINELFPSREACVEHYTQEVNHQRMMRGEIGDNLMYKYRALATSFIWPSLCTAAMQATLQLLISRGALDEIPDLECFWSSFRRFILLRHTWGHDVNEILRPAKTVLDYDVAAWIEGGMPKSPLSFRLSSPTVFEFSLTEESAKELAAALAVWPTTVKGLSKLIVRLRTEWQVRQSHICLGDEVTPEIVQASWTADSTRLALDAAPN
jgi:hypothetical protein